MKHKLVIVGNWKMNKTLNEAKKFMSEFNSLYEKHQSQIPEQLICGIAPNFISMPAFFTEKPTSLKLVAQNMSQHEHGAYTGETSITMIKDIKAQMVILGHSERRAYFGETNELVNHKVLLALKHDLTPIVCVGETLKQYENNQRHAVVKKQVLESLKDVKDYQKVIIAYEPVWAIGTGKTATPEDAQMMCKFIRSLTDQKIIIQYGGSVNPQNIQELMNKPDINGALVGNASLDAHSMIKLLTIQI